MMLKIDRLLEKYQRLTEVSRELIQIAAIQFGPILPTELAKLYRDYCRGVGKEVERHDQVVRQQVIELADEGLLVRPQGYNHGNRLVVAPEVLDSIHRAALKSPRYKAMSAAVFPDGKLDVERHEILYSPWAAARSLRTAFYEGRHDVFMSILRERRMAMTGNSSLQLLSPFDRELFDQLPLDLQVPYLIDGSRAAVLEGNVAPEMYEACCEVTRQCKAMSLLHLSAMLDWCIARGDVEMLETIDTMTEGALQEVRGALQFFRGDFAGAEASLEQAYERMMKQLNRRKMAMMHLIAILRIALLMRHNSIEHRRIAQDDVSYIKQNWGKQHEALAAFLGHAIREQTAIAPLQTPCAAYADSHLCALVDGVIWIWLTSSPLPATTLSNVQRLAADYRRSGLYWLAEEADAVLSEHHERAGTSPTSPVAFADQPPAPPGAVPIVHLIDLLRPKQDWERVLDSLGQLADVRAEAKVDVRNNEEMQVAWYLTVSPMKELRSVSARLRSRLKSGRWGRGKELPLSQLHDIKNHPQAHPYASAQDLRICQCVQIYDPYADVVQHQGRHAKFSWVLSDVAAELAGHPQVYTSPESDHPVEIVHRRPHIWVAQTDSNGDDMLSVSIEPPYDPDDPNRVVAQEDGPHRLILITFTQDDVALAQRLQKPLLVPTEAKQRVVDVAQKLSSMIPVQSEIPIHSANVTQIDGDPRPHLHLIPHGTGLRVEFFVRPMGNEGSFHRPGQGAQNSLLESNGETRVAKRDLRAEREMAQAVIEGCPAFSLLDHDTSQPFFFGTAGESLEMMLQLQPFLAHEEIVLHWPQGEKFTNVRNVTPGQMSLSVRRDRDWLAASGKLKLDDDQELDILELISRMSEPNSRFIELNDGSFLALTEEFRQRISDLAAYAEVEDGVLRFPTIRVAALQDLTSTFTVDCDSYWHECLTRLTTAMSHAPQVPSTFKAELRDYQRDGFDWLSRLAYWGMGACLADDMGLGKTIQALAVLVDRSKDGPALIVAPTSVTYNWLNEAMRFAPTLNVRVFGAGNREEAMQDLGPRDVVITSYGLLHNEAEKFHEQPWRTVVLDEAQAIKNMATKRSQAAMGLQADFRMVLTGTPLENHLGELWNLFQFINPGLLGTWKMFQDRFAIPIERDRCPDTKRRLKKLLTPFILRRTKSQVLQELPPRTEVTIQVELSREETSFYEALRRSALDRLSDVAPEQKGQHVRILGEIMRLRRACCHPKLVAPHTEISGSKLALFLETVDELLDNDHQALVFSQFVDHLRVLRKSLDDRGIRYQYLDGSTPAKERRKRVDAFQSGDGDLFLISLKAGGLGLNLTAADYVLHMDPWWNPAVEDQASDRAHRLGQTRPVTIYRFITTGTIEEQILELHGTKRDLADSLLDGTDVSGKLTTDELLRLLRGSV